MDLKKFINALPDEDARIEFASRCGTTLGHMRNVMYGYRPCAPELAVSIERETAKVVARKDLCPNNWRLIWPELATAKA